MILACKSLSNYSLSGQIYIKIYIMSGIIYKMSAIIISKKFAMSIIFMLGIHYINIRHALI